MTDVLILLTLFTTGVVCVVVGSSHRGARLADEGQRFRVVLPADIPSGGIEHLLLALHGTLRPFLHRLTEGQPWLAFELVGTTETVELFLWVSGGISEAFVLAHVETALPGVRVEPASALTTDETAVGLTVTARGSGVVRTDVPSPGLASLLAGLRGLGEDEHAQAQVLVQPRSPGAQRRLLRDADSHLRGARGADGKRIAPSLADRAIARRLQQKAAAPLFTVGIRLTATAPDRRVAARRTRMIAAGFHQFATAEVQFTTRKPLFPNWFLSNLRARSMPRVPAPASLNSAELAALLGINADVAREAGLPVARGRRLAATSDVFGADRVLGVSDTPTGSKSIGLPVEDGLRHLHLVGPTGTGKSTLILNLALQDIAAGRGVIVLDPKGDLIDAILERMPDRRSKDVILFDPADREWPVGINMLELGPGDEPELVCDNIVAVFRGIYAQFWGPRTDDILKAAILTLLHQPGATLCEVPLLLTDPAFRARYTALVDDPVGLEPFWAAYDSLSPRALAEAIGPISNKLRDFLLRRSVRNIVGQSTSTLDPRTVLAKNQILLCSLRKGLVGEEASALLGSFLIAKLWQAVLARAAVPAAKRPATFVYVDEFQDYLRLPMNFADVLAQARSFRVGLTLAHQHLAQLPPALREGALANAKSRAIFQCSAADARVLARELEPYLTERDLRNLGAYEIAASLSTGGTVSRPFTARTLPPADPTRTDTSSIVNLSRTRYAKHRDEVETEIRQRLAPTAPTPRAYGRRQVSNRPTDRQPEETLQDK